MGTIEELHTLTFSGTITHSKDISGLALGEHFVVIGSDEGTDIQILKKVADREYRAEDGLIQLLDSETEIDIEGIAHEGDTYYGVGSLALQRKRVREDKTHRQNVKRIKRVEQENSKNHLFRLSLHPKNGKVETAIDKINHKDLLSQDEILAPFCHIPSKENGVDIEGLAVDGGTLYLGFRGPVLRSNYVPIMTVEFDDREDYKLLFVQLDGLGIRDLDRVHDGFLIVAGPVGDGAFPFALYHWNGEDCLPGTAESPLGWLSVARLSRWVSCSLWPSAMQVLGCLASTFVRCSLRSFRLRCYSSAFSSHRSAAVSQPPKEALHRRPCSGRRQ